MPLCQLNSTDWIWVWISLPRQDYRVLLRFSRLPSLAYGATTEDHESIVGLSSKLLTTHKCLTNLWASQHTRQRLHLANGNKPCLACSLKHCSHIKVCVWISFPEVLRRSSEPAVRKRSCFAGNGQSKLIAIFKLYTHTHTYANFCPQRKKSAVRHLLAHKHKKSWVLECLGT